MNPKVHRRPVDFSFNPGFSYFAQVWAKLRSTVREKGMKRLITTLLMLIFVVGDGLAQKGSLREQVIGTWIHVSTTVTAPDGKKSDRPGQGLLIYAPDGHFTFVNVANNLPNLAANNRDKATAEEARAIVAGSIAYYGTYTVDEATKTIVPKVEGSTFPNMVGTDQSRVVTSITADEMRFINPKAPAGVLEIVWKRAK